MRQVRVATVKGVLWLGGQRTGTRVLGQIFTIVLLRILHPQDYGLLAMASVFMGLLGLATQVGVEAIIQRQEMDQEFLATAFWANMASGLALFAIAAVSSPWVAVFFREPRIALILVALSLRFVIDSGSATQSALLTREMQYAQLSLRTLLATLIGGCVGVAMAYAGLGVWSLVGQTLTAGVVGLVAVQMVSRWRPRALFSWRRFRELWSFSSPLLLAQFLGYAIRNADNLLVGRYLGPVALGFYALGYSAFVVPLVDFGAPVSQVLFSTLSRLQRDADRLRRVFLLGMRFMTMIALPMSVGLSLVASLLVEVVFGPKWLPSAPVISILAVAAFLRFMTFLGPSALQAVGRTDFQLRWTFLAVLLFLPAFAVGLRWGIVGVASGYLVATMVLTPIMYPFLARAIGVTIADVWATTFPSMVGSAIMTAVVLPAKLLLAEAGFSKGVMLALLVVLGGVAYIGVMAVIQRQWLLRLLAIAREGLSTPFQGAYEEAGKLEAP